MSALLAAGPRRCAAPPSAAANAKRRLALASLALRAPILRPPKFLAIGLNYADHVAEAGLETPKLPTVFNKQSTCVTGPRDPVHLPRVSQALDYEGELGFVIGRRCRHVPRERAHEAIAGYLVVNDVTRARLAAARSDLDDGQVVRHARPDRPVAHHRRRGRRSARPAPAHLGERRAAPGLDHQAPDLRLLRAGRAPLDRRSRSSRAT